MYSDPYEAASNPQTPSQYYYGKTSVQAYFCVLVKGIGKEAYDEKKHKASDKRVAVEIRIVPLAEHNAKYDVERSTIDTAKDWNEISLPSIRALGIASIRDLDGRYVKVSLEPTGRQYTNKNGGQSEATCFKFVGLYAGENECREAYISDGNSAPDNTPPAAPSGGGDSERAASLQFLKALIPNAISGKTNIVDMRTSIAAKLAEFPMINKYFTVDSSEVMQMMMEAMKPA
jgi:hypothetical protein